MSLTVERLRNALYYDPDTGLFTWIRPTSNRAKKGSGPSCLDRHGYPVVRLDGRLYLAHRLAFLYMTGRFPKHDMDHVNGIRSDNRWANLREATRQENLRNKIARKPDAKGIQRLPSGKWRARITVDRQGIHLGCFSSSAEAKAAYSREAVRLFGDFARIN